MKTSLYLIRACYALLILFMPFSSSAQTIRFTNNTNLWQYFIHAEFLSPPIAYKFTDTITGDTVIHSVAYRIMRHQSARCFVREDSAAGKIYAMAAVLPDYDDSTEQLVYDYNLHTGDTFRNRHSVYHVADMDTVIISSTPHKVWHFTHISSDSTVLYFVKPDYYVVEGIGSLAEPFFPLSPYAFEAATTLTCFSTNGATPPLDHNIATYFDNTTSCALNFGLGINDLVDKNMVTVAPNPIDENSRIILSKNVISGTLIVANNIGQIVINLKFSNKSELPLGELIRTPGMYYYSVRCQNEVYTGRFVY